MSFMTERYFQILENHKVYKQVQDEASLRTFAEHHVLCAWAYSYLVRNLYQELVARVQPLASQSQKEAQRLIATIILEEEFEEQEEGGIASHFELYIEAMQDLGADISPIMTFFDLHEHGEDWLNSAANAGFPAPAQRYFELVMSFAARPLHERAALLFYEGEPFIPDNFLIQLAQSTLKTDRLVDYFERHIEGLKKPGFSASGRLVELFCGDDAQLNDEAEKAAEMIMRARIELWNELSEKIAENQDRPASRPSHLKVVNIRSIVKDDVETAS